MRRNYYKLGEGSKYPGSIYYPDPSPADLSYAMEDAWGKPSVVYSQTTYHTFILSTYWTREGVMCDLEEHDNNLNVVFKATMGVREATNYILQTIK